MTKWPRLCAFAEMVVALAIASGLCYLGEMDDAPGLGGLGMLIALGLLAHACVLAKVVTKRTAWIVIYGVLGIACLIFPFVLFAGGEIELLSPAWLLLLLAVWLLLRARKLYKEGQRASRQA